MTIRSMLAASMSLATGLAVTAMLASCGDAGARDAKPAPAKEPGHGEEGHSCPLCDGMKEGDKNAQAKDDVKKETALLDLTMNSIDGKPINLATAYAGKVVLVVNVASKCGLTPQYEGLEKLYKAKAGEGLVILGFPANNFMGQEPGTNAQVAEFCKTEYGVTFPMFEKISVKGDDAHELYKRLTVAAKESGGEPSWNFTKYLVGRDGKLITRFGPRVAPDAKELTIKIDEALKAGK